MCQNPQVISAEPNYVAVAPTVPIYMTGESVFIKVPADTSADDIALVSLRAAANLGLDKMSIKLFGFVANTADGGTKIVDLSMDQVGYISSAMQKPIMW
ncbi:MAG: hypothetical protein IKG11_03780 [Atopobiaceae bacterium]|nr:hypothetical protein [Atopobiaceae bacterium]